MIVAIVISTEVTIYFVYYNRFLIKNNISCTKSNTRKENNLVNLIINGVNKTNNY